MTEFQELGPFKIIRWDGILQGCSNNPKPALCFIPSNELIASVPFNKLIKIKISGTGKYDGDCVAHMGKRYCTNFYIMVLQRMWNGYPDKHGIMSIPTEKCEIVKNEVIAKNPPNNMALIAASGSIILLIILLSVYG